MSAGSATETSTPAQRFLRDAAAKSADLVHREIIRKNMESYDAAHLKGRARFQDWEAARRRCQEIKREAIGHLDRYLLQFEEKVVARGGHVFWAEDAEQACRYICDLAEQRGVKTVVKSKSMVTEEIELSAELEKIGVKAWETDLGEYIVQLRHEPPYHIVTPAMHLNRKQIGDLFRRELEPNLSDDPAELMAAARRKLRQAFFSAEMGISGANFIVADVGAIAISTNEGNGRLTTSLPRVHVAVTGIEKIIPRLEDLATLWPVLATSGTGQPITTYSTLIGGPRRPGEVDGPEEFHVVLVDNGRSRLLENANAEEREVLHCIRCGACLNICPVYRHIGGHAYGTIYGGPIGSALTPHLRGREFAHLSSASSLCGACTSVCPVRIDLHRHLLHNRRDFVNAGITKFGERMMFSMWSAAMQRPWLYSAGGTLARLALRTLYALGLAGSALDPMRAWNHQRTPVPLPKQSFRARWKRETRP